MIAALPLLDSGHATTLLATALVAAACIGLGLLAGARRPELALSAGWGVGVLVLTLAGCLTSLPFTPLLVVLAIAGLAGLGWRHRLVTPTDWAASGRVLLLAAPFLLMAGAVTPASFDDYSHWLPNLGHLVLHDHFSSRAVPDLISIRPGYPHATTFIGLAVSRLTGRLAEGAAVVWNALLLVSVGGLAAALLARRLAAGGGPAAPWGCAAIGLLLATVASPSFVPRLFLSNYGDGPVGSVAGVMVAVLALTAAEGGTVRAAWALGFAGAALISIRQDAFSVWALVVAAALALALLRGRLGLRWRVWQVGLMLPAPVIAWAAWVAYQHAEIPGGAASVLPLARWHWAAMPAVLGSMLHVMATKGGYFGLLLAELVAAALILWRPGRATALGAAALVAGAIVGMGKIVAMAGTYLAVDFGAPGTAEAHEFWRFTVQVGPAVLVAGMALVPVVWLLTGRGGRWLGGLAGGAIVLAPIIAAHWLRPDVPRAGHTPYLWLRSVAHDIAERLPPGARLALVDLDHHPLVLPAIFPLRERLLLGEPIARGLAPPRVSQIAGEPPQRVAIAGDLPHIVGAAGEVGDPFVWTWNGGPAASRLLGIELPPGEAALLAREAGHPVVLQRWPLPK